MILTLTPNPSLDLLFSSERLVWDDANRVPMPRRRAGGQGINVVRALRALRPRAEALAIAPLGGAYGEELRRLLEAEDTPLHVVAHGGETRVFVAARERESGRSLLLNPRGPEAAPGLANELLDSLTEALARRPGGGRGAWVACCGSLLPGLPEDFYARAGEIARSRGVRFVPDCDGPALAAAAGLADLLVPNDLEAARLTGLDIESPPEAVAAGRALLRLGPHRVVVTMGARGAVAVTAEEAWWARPSLPPALARVAGTGSPVGAGDALLAALLTAEERSEGAALAEAVATGTAVLLGRGGTLVDPEDVDRVRPCVEVERIA